MAPVTNDFAQRVFFFFEIIKNEGGRGFYFVAVFLFESVSLCCVALCGVWWCACTWLNSQLAAGSWWQLATTRFIQCEVGQVATLTLKGFHLLIPVLVAPKNKK